MKRRARPLTLTKMNRAGVLELLAITPLRIASATRRLSGSELNWKPAADSWSINEVLAHLRCCADVWGESIRKILKQDQPTFRYVSPRGRIKKTNYLELEFKASFLAFDTQRQELLKTLRAISTEDWLRRANVRATKVREETVLSYAERLANHESGHCEQIERVLRALSLSDRR
jgi:uncharacterized damage-inducible protein DinB